MSYMTYLSPTAKSQLSKTIRNLRDRLITDLHNAVESKYLMGVKLEQVQLDEERYCKRERLEKYLEELVKGDLAVYKGKQSPKLKQELRDRHRQDLEKLAAATWLNRLAVIKHLEAMELLKPKLVTGVRNFGTMHQSFCKRKIRAMGCCCGWYLMNWRSTCRVYLGGVG